MATIPTDRMFTSELSGMTAKAPCINLPLTANSANQSLVPGDLLIATTTGAQGVANAPGNVATLIAIAEGSTGTATPIALTMMPTTLLVPFMLWEGTFVGTPIRDDMLGGTEYDLSDNAIGCVINRADTTDPKIWVLALVSESSRAETGAFIGMSDATPTAGVITNYNARKGVLTDVNPRVLFFWDKDRIPWGV